ncbi:hypothetical protein V2I01_37925 [Micromonospora sp. BRA006-A]|nr:hypothetical protein [Micromonospora sp. BRA006-A]
MTAAHARLVAAQVDHWRANARAVYGARGLLAPSRTDGEHGHLFHVHPDWPFTAWLAGADWLLHPLHEHHLVTGEPLGEVAGWLAEVADFFADVLTAGGRPALVPSYSPETGPYDDTGRAAPVAVNATMDVAAARHALAAGRRGHRRRQVGRGAAAGLPGGRAWRARRVGVAGQHRRRGPQARQPPVSGVAAARDRQGRHPELAAAAHRALTLRGDENRSAHGSLHRALAAARLRDGDLVAANLRKILGADMFFRSLMSAHNPGRTTYNADAAHALPAVLIESLVQSRPGTLRLLPAPLPGLPAGTRGASPAGAGSPSRS